MYDPLLQLQQTYSNLSEKRKKLESIVRKGKKKKA
jgi:hypothetical protein